MDKLKTDASLNSQWVNSLNIRKSDNKYEYVQFSQKHNLKGIFKLRLH
jgi:hypothetical protein